MCPVKINTNYILSYDYIVFKFKNTYFYSLVDLSQAELLLSGLKQLFEKQNDENSQLQNKLDIKPVENNGMLLYRLIICAEVVFCYLFLIIKILKNFSVF